MKLKKILAAVSAAAVLFGTTACTADSGKSDNSASDGADGKTYKVGICQLVEHPALDAATQGFMDALKAKLGDSVTFDN